MVGIVAVAAIVLSVAVDVAGGESVRNMSALRGLERTLMLCPLYVSLSSTLPHRWMLPLHILFLLLFSLCLLLLLFPNLQFIVSVVGGGSIVVTANWGR